MPDLKLPPAVLTIDIFPLERAALLELLNGLSDDGWRKPTVCPGWSVKDIALHVLGGDLNNLSRRRDGFQERVIGLNDDLVAYLNGINDAWVQGARRLSNRVIVELLRDSGKQTYAYFAALDPFGLGGPVTWAGPAAAPIWLDIAREYTERWVHQQQIRDAVSQPRLKEPRYLAPVLATFVRAVPQSLRPAAAPEGSTVVLEITGDAGSVWSAVRGRDGWSLMEGQAERPLASVSVDQDLAWRLFTRGVNAAEVYARVQARGDAGLITTVLNTVSIIA